MAVLDREGFFNKIKEYVGEDVDENALGFIEDITDTYTHMETVSADGANWETRYTELDEKWKKKYKERFFGGGEDYTKPDDISPRQLVEESNIKISDLFTKKEG